MISAQRFLFNRDFDPDLMGPDLGGSDLGGSDLGSNNRVRSGERAKNGRPANGRSKPAFTEDDLARVRAEGFAEGREQASREAAQSMELRLTESFETVGERLYEVISSKESGNAAAAREAIAIAVAIARRMVPELYRRNAVAEIEHTVATVLSQVLETAELTVRIAESLADPLRERIKALAETRGIGDRVRIMADPSLTEGDCRIEWLGGGAERNTAAMWDEIEAIVEKNLGFVPALAAGESDPAELNAENTTPMLDGSTSEPSTGTEVGETHG